jgi:hypothetical protein
MSIVYAGGLGSSLKGCRPPTELEPAEIRARCPLGEPFPLQSAAVELLSVQLSPLDCFHLRKINSNNTCLMDA